MDLHAVFLLAVGHFIAIIHAKGVQEVCHFEKFQASCAADEVIVVKSARYGRMHGKCITEEVPGHTGCSADIRPHMDGICSGRRNCSMDVADKSLHQNNPCSKELLAHLEIDYDCIKVATGNRHHCSVFGGQRLGMGSKAGYISSSTLFDGAGYSDGATGPGSPACPWMLHAQRGQRFNISLLNFVAPDHLLPSTCHAKLMVKDGNFSEEISLCAQRGRQTKIYTSRHHDLSIAVKGISAPLKDLNFLIRYNVFGCSDITNISRATVTRTGETLSVVCDLTGETFYLTCIDATWKGELGNCTKAVPLGSEKKRFKDDGFPYGLLIVIGIGVALGVALGIILLFGILFCLRRRKKKEHPRSHTTDPLLHSETPQESEETGQGSWYSTRAGAGFIVKDVICPHGLATLARHAPLPGTLQNKSGGHYADSTELQRAVPLGGSAATLSHGNGELVQYPQPEPMCVRRPNSPGRELDEGPEMQTSFITFKPGTPTKGQRIMESENSVDLIKDSLPYRQLSPEALVVECTCTLRPNSGPRSLAPDESPDKTV